MGELDQIRAARTAPALCLIHGDCHAENLLRDGDQLVWVDWQAVGPGHGPEDLALLWQRAEFNGADVPRTATLAAYADARGITIDTTFRCAMVAAEIELLLMGWPAFLLRLPGSARDVLIRRLHELATAWRQA